MNNKYLKMDPQPPEGVVGVDYDYVDQKWFGYNMGITYEITQPPYRRITGSIYIGEEWYWVYDV